MSHHPLPLAQTLGGTGTSAGAGAASVAWSEKAISFTTEASKNYLCTNGAGAGIVVTLNSSPVDGEEFVLCRQGVGAVMLSANTINGVAYRMGACAFGRHVFRYHAGTSSWWTSIEASVGLIPSASLVQFITAQAGYTVVSGASNDTWADQSGNGYNFTTNASATDPTYSATGGGSGNHPAVSPAANSYMDSPDGAQWNIDTCTVVMGLKVADRTTANILNHFSTNVGWSFTHSEGTTGKCNAKFQASSVADAGDARLGEGYHVLSFVHTTTVNEVRFYIDGQLNSVVTCTGTAGDLAGPLRLWATQSGANMFNGGYLGHAIYNAVLSDVYRQYVESFYHYSGIH